MDIDIAHLHSLEMFQGIQEQDMNNLLKCMGSYIETYQKGELIYFSEDQIASIGIVLEGCVHMIKEDVWGRKSILVTMQEGEVFGETFACRKDNISQVTFTAQKPTKVLYLPFHRILHTCQNTCLFHHKLIENMVMYIARKNYQLIEKVEVTSKKSLREKILTYLSLESKGIKGVNFDIPLGRIELADYLCSDRSAVARELKTMKEESIIDYYKNTFKIL